MQKETDRAHLTTEPVVSDVPDYWAIFLEASIAVAENLKLLIAGPIIAGLIAYVVVATGVARNYTSAAFIGPIEEQVAKTAEAMIHSPTVLDAVLRKFPDYPAPGMANDLRRGGLDARLQWTIAKGADPKKNAMYGISFEDTDPARAQAILRAVIDEWLNNLAPRADNKARIGIILKAAEAQVADLSRVIDEIKKRPELLIPDAKNNYLPPNLADMIKLRTEGVTRVEDLKILLSAGSRDMVFSEPSLPTIQSSPVKRLVVLYSMLGTFVLLLIIALLRHAFHTSARRPEISSRVSRIAALVRPWPKSH